MLNRLLSSILVVVLFQLTLKAQDVAVKETRNTKPFWIDLDMTYGIAFLETCKEGNGYGLKDMGDIGILETTSLRLKAGYFITPQLSLGAGIGSYIYSGMTKFVPVFVDVRYRIKQTSNLYVFADVGTSFFKSAYLHSGFVTEFGAGYKIRICKIFALNPTIGYNLGAAKGTHAIFPWDRGDEHTHVRHGIFAGLTFEF